MTEPTDVALVIGIAEYDDPALAPLPEAGQEAALIRAGLAGAGFATPPPLVGRHSLAAVLEYLSQAPASARRVVVYWTGHGVAGPDGHWLFTSDSRAAAPDEGSAMSAARLTASLESIPRATQVVAILDSCGAGATAAQVARAVNDAPRQRPRAGRRPVALSIISATYDEAAALPLVFARSLAAALRDGPPWTTWPAQLPVIPPQDLARAADSWLREYGAPEAQRVRCTGVESGTGFFTNPRYNPNARDIVLGGSAFVQRRGVLEAIHGWAAASPSGLFLLTGSAGTGKSSVVAQLAEPAGGSGPPGRGVVLVNLAGGATLRGLLADLAPRAGAPAAGTPEELAEALRASGRRITVVVDSLDEADPGDRADIVQRLLLPLSGLPGVHVIVAARGGAGDVPGRDVGLIRQSASGWFSLDADPDAQTDIARHVTSVLTGTPSSPYRDDPDQIAAVAAAVARAGDGVFLIASTVAAALARSPDPVGPADPGLQQVLQAGIGGAIASDLARFGARRESVVAALAPLAWIEGPGVPVRPVWLRLAQALAASGAGRISEETIDWVIANAGFYLTASSRDGELVYRLRHQSFADYLRGAAEGPADGARAVHHGIVAALRPAPGGWPAADPYVLRYLPVHAERAGLVTGLFDDPDAMAWADPATLADVASRVPAASRPASLHLYLRAGPRLERLEPPMRAFLLQSLDSEGVTESGARPRVPLRFSVPPPCTMLWTSGPRASSHRLLRAAPEDLGSLAVLPAEGRCLIAMAERAWGPRGRSVLRGAELFDPESTAPGQRLPALAGAGVAALVHVRAPDDQLLVSAYENNVLEAWSLRRRAPLWSRDTGRMMLRCHLLRSRGEHLVAITNSSGPVHVWHPVTGTFLRAVEPSEGAVFAVWFTVDGRDRLCVGDNTGLLSLFDADTFAPLGDVEPEECWTAAGFGTVQGRPTLIGARTDGRVEMRHADDGRLLAVSQDESENIAELLCVVDGPSGRPVAATSDGAVIVLWATAPLQRAGFLTGHTDEVTALGILPGSNGLNSLVSASADGTVRAWPPVDDPRRDFSSPPALTDYRRVHLTEIGGRAVLLAEGPGEATVVDAESGTPVRSFGQPFMTTRDPDYAVPDIRGVVARGADAMALTYHDGGAQRMWSLTSGKYYALPAGRFDAKPARVTVVGANAAALLVIGDGTRQVASFGPAGALAATFEDSGGAMPGPALAGREDQVLLYKAGWLAVYDARTGTRLAAAVLPHPDGTPQAAGADQHGVWVVYGAAGATWLAGPGFLGGHPPGGDRPPIRLVNRYTRGTAAVTCAGHSYAAVADQDQMLLVRPADGSVALRIPFIGQIWDIAAAGPGQLWAVAGGRLAHVRLAAADGPGHAAASPLLEAGQS